MGGDRQGRGDRARPLGVAALALAGLWLFASCADATARLPAVGARGQIWVRVLLFEGVDEVVVSSGGRDIPIRAEGPDGLRAGTGEVGSRWRSPVSDAGIVVRGPGRTARVRGAVEVLAASEREEPGAAGLAVVNEIPLEQYLAGTLGREMYGSWAPGALRAQAVASRTYAVHQMLARAGAPWHLRSGTRSQVYGGLEAESDPVEDALEATRGEVLVRDGRPILAVFHSSSGGRTASAVEVWGQPRDYLVSVEVDDEWDSPDSYWRARVTRGTLGRAVAKLGTDVGPIVSAEILERTGSGRVARLRLRGEQGELTLTGRELRTALGESKLRSTLFELREDDQAFVFVGSGRGHGVGMSQWGARAMARRGDDYRMILETFYPGTELSRLP